MAASAVAIVNSALIKLGVETITSLSGTSKQAVLANEQYTKIRDDLLARYYWAFAKKRVALVEDTTAPAFEYENRFVLPNDYIRALYVYPSGTTEWLEEGGYLLTNDESVELVYIAQITDTTKFSKTFDEVFALRLAYDLAYPLVQSVTLKESLYNEYKNEIRDVRSIDSMLGTPVDYNDDVWLRARIESNQGASPYFGNFRRFP